jgi:hypothetical protein
MTLPEAKHVPPYTDARPETVVVPADYPLDYMFIPADRSIKRSTLVAAIAADGIGLKPLIIVSRLAGSTSGVMKSPKSSVNIKCMTLLRYNI